YKVDYVLVGHSHLYEKGEKNGVKYITSGSAGDGSVNANVQYANHPEIQLSILDNVYVKFFVNQDSVRFNVINKNSQLIDSEFKTKGYTPYSVQATVVSPACNGAADGSASLSIQGPRPPYSVQWFDGTSGNTHTGLAAGTYYAYITDGLGCEKVTQVTVTDPVFFSPAIQSTQNSPARICAGQDLTLQCGNFASYLWSTGAVTPQIQVSAAGSYTVTVTDSLGCSKTSAPFVVTLLPAPDAQFSTGQNGLNYVFTAQDASAVSYQWDFGDGTQLTHTQPTIFHSYTQNGTYTVTLTVTNACGSDAYTQIVSSSVSLEEKELFPVSVYPNPAGESVWIEAEGLSRVQLYDISGKCLQDKGFSGGGKQQLDVSAYGPGVYWLQISGSKGSVIRKISVQ
ncbi:MAG: PKD domain-containing protein, partial [Bacteroidia bacterium]|nr:PKD domain-containing protein [Bacteroidia bacterium]